MTILQVKGIDDDLSAELKEMAEAENEFLMGLSGSWKDDRSAEEIVRELRKAVNFRERKP